jgi:Ser/Thr protein kinase RdoA (MazF antagonist)
MPDPQLIAGLVRRAYGAEPIALEPLGNDLTGERVTYSAALDDGRIVLLRGLRLGSRLPLWHGGGGAEAWLRERARVLEWLAQQGYPAPRVVRARNGKLLATDAGYCALAITYLPGRLLPRTTQHLERLGGVLGWLHALGARSGTDVSLPASWWHPLDHAITPLLAQLDGVRAAVPARWQPLHAAFVATLAAVGVRGDLPLTTIHGDCYPANAVETTAGEVALIDWDCAGRGAAVLDLGSLLLAAQPDIAVSEPLTVDPRLVAAMLAGYRQHREPTVQERTHLLAATRFGVAFVGALRFAWAREQGWSERLEWSLRRLQARYTAAEEVARLAQEALGGCQ